MSLTNQKILGITITTNPKKEILEYIQKYLLQRQKEKGKRQNLTTKPLVIVTPNPEQVVYAGGDSRFADLLNGADIAIPDGIGLVAAMRLLEGKRQKAKGKRELQKISGVELMEDLVVLAAEKGFPIALIGGRTGVALKALECLQLRYPDLKGWAEEGVEVKIQGSGVGIPNTDPQSLSDISGNSYVVGLARRINTTGIKIVFVGLGAPKQEFFIEQLKIENLKPALPAGGLKIATPLALMSVGGAFDEISGTIPRAPVFMDRLGLKWLWRLIIEPWRWRRQLSLLKFIGLVINKFLNHSSI